MNSHTPRLEAITSSGLLSTPSNNHAATDYFEGLPEHVDFPPRNENLAPHRYPIPRSLPSASPIALPPISAAETGSGSEAALTQVSPAYFIQNHVTGTYFMDSNESMNLGPFFDDNTGFPTSWNDFTDSSERQLLTVLAHKKSNSLPTLHQPDGHRPFEPHSYPLQELGVRSTSYHPEMPFVTTAMDHNAAHGTSQGGTTADLELKHLPITPKHERCGSANQTMAATSKNNSSSSDEDSSGRKCTLAPSSDQLPREPATQKPRAAARAPHALTESGRNSPHHTEDSITSNSSSHSMHRMPGYQRTAPPSTSGPNLPRFKKPARPLTKLQMVSDTTHYPTMPLVEVTLEAGTNTRTVESIDYRDASWQGRSDEHKGWTPYVEFADFPSVHEMLQSMRDNPEGYMPDTATIFTSIDQVDTWRENEGLKNGRKYQLKQDDDIPKTLEEKAALVKLLFKAFKSTVDGRSNKMVQALFENQIHSNAQVEAVCWQLLEAAIRRSTDGPLTYAYEPEKATKSAIDKCSTFAARIDDLIAALMREKSVCCALLKTPKILDTVDYPSFIGKRTANNRTLNAKKAVVAKLGQQKMKEMELNAEHIEPSGKFARGSSRRGKRRKDEFNDDSDSTEESPPKRRSPERSDFSTPQRCSSLSSGYGYTPLSSQLATNNSTPRNYTRVDSPAPSTTASIREGFTGFDFGGIAQPSFGHTSGSVPQSPMRHSLSLDGVGAQMQPPQANSDFGNAFCAVNGDGSNGGFFD